MRVVSVGACSETRGVVEVTIISHGCVWSCSFGALDPGDGGTKLLQNDWKNLPVDRV